MVQHAMLCDYLEGRNWPHRTGGQIDQETVAAHLSLSAVVAEYKGESPRSWVGYVLSEEDRAVVRVVSAKYPILEQPLEWFGRDAAAQRWALCATGALDELDDTGVEIALGLLDGWDSSVERLLEAAKLLS
jgi:hypothetical protein